MVLDNDYESQFVRGELLLGLCDFSRKEPLAEDYKRIKINPDDFLYNVLTKQYVNFNEIWFPESKNEWGEISHCLAFDLQGNQIGFDRFEDKKIYNIKRKTNILFSSENLKILFVE